MVADLLSDAPDTEHWTRVPGAHGSPMGSRTAMGETTGPGAKHRLAISQQHLRAWLRATGSKGLMPLPLHPKRVSDTPGTTVVLMRIRSCPPDGFHAAHYRRTSTGYQSLDNSCFDASDGARQIDSRDPAIDA